MKQTKPSSVWSMTALALVATLALAGCEKRDTTTTTTTPPSTTTTTSSTTMAPSPTASAVVGDMAASAGAMASRAGDAVADAAVTAKVKTAFLADTDVKGLQIDVDTKDGVVTLNGAVTGATNVDKAATIAKGIDGVKSVNNRLTVRP